MTTTSCHKSSKQPDYLLWGSGILIIWCYGYHFWWEQWLPFFSWHQALSASVFELMNTMWWGILMGILMIGLLTKIPREICYCHSRN